VSALGDGLNLLVVGPLNDLLDGCRCRGVETRPVSRYESWKGRQGKVGLDRARQSVDTYANQRGSDHQSYHKAAYMSDTQVITAYAMTGRSISLLSTTGNRPRTPTTHSY
jgi:hypothetical protein